MKKNISTHIFVFLLVTVLASFTGKENERYAKEERPGTSFCGMSNTSFSSGEELTINVYYAALGVYIKAGVLTMTTTQTTLNGKQVYHAKAYGRTLSSYDWAFKVRDTYETYMNVSNLQSEKFVRNVEEGKYRSKENYTFNDAENKITTTNKTYVVPDCTLDVVAAIYNARNIDFSKYKSGDKIPFKIVIDEKLQNLYIRYMGKETVSTKFGKFKAIKLKPLLVKGNTFSGGEKMTVWFSDDGNRVPLRIESALAVGSVKADLVEYSGLRYGSLTSRVE